MDDQEMRDNPLCLADLNAASQSAHAFWKKSLECNNHDHGVDAVAFSNGTVEIHCHTCKRLLGVLLLAKEKR